MDYITNAFTDFFSGGAASMSTVEAQRSNLPGRLNGPADAYRHMLLAAEMTRTLGEDYARAALGLHEAYGNFRGQSQEAYEMDLHNNEIGIRIGNELRDNPDATWEDVVARVREQINPLEPDGGFARWLPSTQWERNPIGDDGHRMDNSDPALNWPNPVFPDGPFVPVDPIIPYDDPYYYGYDDYGVYDDVSTDYVAARNWLPRRDPLVLDLDGDGIETVGIDPNNPVLFDLTGSGVKIGVGWIRSDDGFLVLDRNANGTIDDGRELFGDATPLLAGGTAADGLAALADLDFNADGKIDLNDAVFTQLRVWQDFSQDGISQSDELFGFDALGISAINLTRIPNNRTLADGNQIADQATFERIDGSDGGVGTSGVADVNLAIDTFHREFTDHIALTPAAQALPYMRGSGAVRDLREAASLSDGLAAAVQQTLGYHSRSELLASADAIIVQWAETSGMQTSVEKAAEKHKRLIYLAPGQTIEELGLFAFAAGGGSGSAEVISPAEQQKRAERRAQQTRITGLMALLERFNGTTFVEIQDTRIRTGAGVFLAEHDPNANDPFAGVSPELNPLVFVPISAPQLDLLERSYNRLKQSVYDALLFETRLKSYIEQLALTLDQVGNAVVDFSALTANLEARFAAQPGEAVRDLLDLQRRDGTALIAFGWEGYDQLRSWLRQADSIADPAQRAAVIAAINAGLADFAYAGRRTAGDGTNASEVVVGADAGAVLNGGAGDDLVLGGAGDDVLNGGSGNDKLYGGAGSDTYVFNLGDGLDAVCESQGGSGIDTLQFGPGIAVGDLDIFVSGADLVFAHANGRDKISIAYWFAGPDEAAHRLDVIRFADGSTLDLSTLQLGSERADVLTGTEAQDLLFGGDGNDTLTGLAGNDLLNGGTGLDQMAGGVGDDSYVVDNAGDAVIELPDEGIDTVSARVSATLAENVENMLLVGTGDTSGTGNALDNVITGNSGANALHGMDGNDALSGGAGNDSLNGGAGMDMLSGGTGNDALDGGTGADAMSGGTGNDRYIVDDVGDVVTELAGEGTDTVETGLTYTLGANLENLSLTGMDAVDGTGNELANVLTGNSAGNTLAGLAGNDTLNGGAGADTMLGGTGNDTYVVESAGDLVAESAGEGIDLVQSSITYTLTGNVENLTLTGTAAIDGTGNTLDNAIVGNSTDNLLTGLEGHDTLDGRAGADTMSGGLGDDTYVVERLADVVLENAGEGTDTVQSEISYTLLDNFENLTLIGGGSINGTGNAADNVLVGNGGHNVLDGAAGADLMAGGSGNDAYILDNTGDVVVEQGGSGTDTVIAPFDYTLSANLENLTLTGTALTGTGNALDNSIVGTSAHNTLTGLDGNDVLDGGEGADTLIGGRGNDIYVVDSLLDSVAEAAGEGVDTVQSSLTWTLGASLENLTLTGSAAIDGTGNELNNVLTGNSADNVLTSFEGDDTLDGGAGADTLTGGMGSDTYVVDNTGDLVTENLNEGADLVRSSITYTLTGNVENLTLTGVAAINGTGNMLDNVLIGNAGANILSGLEGNDTLNGGEAADTLIGGTGDDTYFVDNTADIIVENAGEGSDTVFASATYTLADNIENLTLSGTASIGGTGNALGNIIVGNSGNNALHGLAGNDTLTGNAGADTLDGGLDADTMAGGAGNDTYVVDNAGDLVTEHLNGGLDEVRSSISYALGSDVENLTLTGSGSITGTGNELSNVIFGNAGDNLLFGMEENDTLLAGGGNDMLDGGLGADRMGGGMGDDTYVVDNAGDLVAELTGEGLDTVLSGIAYALTANVENLTLTGGAAIDGTGNTLNNILIGNTANNRLDGAAGADTMLGGMGNDTYIVDDMGDVVTENADAGIDTVQSSISYTLTGSVENLVLTGTADLNGTGNMLDNAITGTGGGNVLDGGAGVDTMAGGAGDDTYIVDDTADMVVEGFDAGTDTVRASATYTLSDNVENLVLTGTGDINGTGNALANTITANSGLNILAGLGGDDTYIVDSTADAALENAGEGIDTVQSSATYTLSANVENLILTGIADIDGTGNAGDNTITGNSGANVIDGAAGADSMAGGAGSDTYIVDNAGDVVIEAAGADTDFVLSSVTYTLATNVENLTLTGAADIDATGNELNNALAGNTGNNRLFGLGGADSLTGNHGNDLLDGGTGADTMAGNAGNDTYVVDNAADAVTESLDEGVDLVQSSITYTLGDNVENLVLTGTGNINGTGNLLDNAITGNSGNNTLDGGAGMDTLSGGAGNDTYVVDHAADAVLEGLNAGTDTVLSSVTYTLSANVENLTLTGTADINGTGNVLANTITANSGLNTLAGLGGNDTYVVDSTNDVVVENANEGIDLVQSSATYTLSANVENLTLTGSADINGTGNGLANIINGNSGANIIDGGAGADTMAGAAGNDTYIVDNAGDLVTEAANAGIDQVFSSVSYTLTANVENLTLTGTANINGTGNTLNNIIVGNVGNNVLDGSTGADTMLGGTGNDTYVVDNAADVVTENLDEGVDLVQASVSYTLSANVENLTLTGGAAINGTGNALSNVIVGNISNNVLSGLAGSDTLTGNAGNDTLDGGLDADTMAGGQGNDTYVVDNVGDLVSENLNEGTDLVQSSITYTLTANVENLTLTGVADINGTGNTLANVITGNSGINILDGGLGADTINAGAGNDTLIGGDGNDSLSGEAGSDAITGDAGDDTLNGGLDADSMAGGTGNDTYVVDNVGDLVSENLNEGTDLVQSSITYTLTDNVENLTLTGAAAINGTGNVLNNVIIGNTAANTLTGLEGNDTLDGGAGADTMLGGTGNDTYVVDNAGDVVTESLDEGVDLVLASVSYTLSANVENLTLTGANAINGTGNGLNNVIAGNINNNVLSGLAGSDTLTGNAGNDTLDGGLDADTMAGGQGNDTYVVDNVGDLVSENLNEGTDLVQSSITYTLTANVENLTLTGVADLNGTGNLLNNVITGNSGSNILDGAAGADTINAGAGNDTLIGGDGNDALNGEAGSDAIAGDAGDDTLNGGLDADSMAGGTGNDTYVVDNAGDVVSENLNEGTDLVQSSITYTLTDNVENLTLTGAAAINGTGNVLNNVIIGNTAVNVLTGLEGNDTLDGAAGADTMLGGTGNDTYVVDNAGDVVTESLDEGVDLVQASVSYTLSANVENLTLTGANAINGTGNGLNNVMVGNTNNNVLSGLGGNDTLTGNAGADTLDGGLDADTMSGNAGNDTYVVDNTGDLVTEALNEGTDLVNSSITYTLTANVENLTLTGVADLNGTGNVLNNLITGNSGANVIDGAAGADTMSGGAGDDTYIVDNTSDVITESAGGGIDIALASANYTLSANLEDLTLTGTANINGTGNTLGNVLTGNSGANTLNGDAGNDLLNGGLGADTMAGGAGDDSFIVESSGDVVSEALNAGTDTVQSSISYTLTANLENLVLTGAGDLNGTGNTLNNSITGTIGANTLDGGAGADALSGGAGSDTYLVDNSADAVVEGAGEGIDLVLASASFTLSDNVENLTLVGSGNVNGTGNALANALTGNGGDNLLAGLGGDDTLSGGSGDDSYIFNLGDGVDTIHDVSTPAAPNRIVFGAGIVRSDLSFVQQDGVLTIHVGTGGDALVLPNFNFSNVGGSAVVGFLEFADGTIASLPAAADRAPIVTNPIADQSATEDAAFSFTISTDVFADPDIGDPLSLSVTHADGSALPGWLTLDPATRTLSGTPLNGDVGILSLRASATDSQGLSTSDIFALTVANTNDAPVLVTALADQLADEDAPFSFALPANTFADDDLIHGDALTFGATLADGSPLPAWLSFDAATGTFTGTPANADVGSFDVRVSAADGGGASATDTFSVTARNVNDAPVLANPLADQGVIRDEPFLYQVPADAFADEDVIHGDTLSYGATLADGSTLPAWLSFDALTRSFSGTPAIDDVGSVDVVVSATDAAGASAADVFSLSVFPGVIFGTELDDVLLGSRGNDEIYGFGGNDSLSGLAGNDFLDGGLGADLLDGATGDDTFVYSVDAVWDSGFQATNQGSPGHPGSERTVNLAGKSRSFDVYRGGSGTDTLVGSASADAVFLDDTFSPAPSGATGARFADVEIFFMGGGDDIVDLTSPIHAYGDAILDGGSGRDILWASSGNDTLLGGAGFDQLDGGAGADVMRGGADDDSYWVDDAGDAVIEVAGEGIDSVNTALSYVLGDNVENLMLTGGAAVNGTGNSLDNVLDGSFNSAANVLTGGLGNDRYRVGAGDVVVELANEGTDTVDSTVDYTLGDNLEHLILSGNAANGTGNALNNLIEINSGANGTLIGLAGNDEFHALGGGNATLIGGTGDDAYLVDAFDIIVENAGEGTDTVLSTNSYTLGANLENLVLLGSSAVNGTGNALDNVITGSFANNVLNGGFGADTMVGGQGNDTFIVDNAGDVVSESPGPFQGVDTVQSSVTYTIGDDDVENLVLTGTAAINGTGNSSNNVLTGNSGANVLTGAAGNDTYVVGTGDSALENANEGVDTVQSSLTWTLGANLENLTLTGTTKINGTGNALDNVLTGNSAANTLAGGTGNDTYFVSTGDTVTEAASAGTDTVMADVTWTLGANVENLNLIGTAAINGTGNTLNNVLAGNGANNTLSGGTGADTMAGGLGNDTYVVDNASDVVTENGNEGTDLVQSSVTFTLSANVESLTLTGTTAINGAGNALDNVLTGNSGANVLTGGAGNDTYVVGTGDSVVENVNEGIDTVQSSITWTLGANLENLSLSGTTAINGTGNALDNVLSGNSAANVLTGGVGNDTYFIGTGDTVTEAAGGGEDLVNSSITSTLGANLEHLILAGTAAINATGNAVANLIRGNTANNTLTGAAGIDVLEGGAGNDTLSDSGGTDNGLLNGGAGTDTLTGGTGRELYIGGAGNDTLTTGTGAEVIVYNRGDGLDTVNASSGQDNMLSLGGAIRYADLAFRVSGSNLVLDVGAGDSITFVGWYTGTTNRSVLTLQVIAEAMAGFNPGSGDPLLDNKVETFDFAALVAGFDQARAANPALTSWSLTNKLLEAHLSGSDTAALGGDLAYQYGRNGNLGNVGFTAAQGLLSSAQFGTQAQALQPLATLQEGFVRLS